MNLQTVPLRRLSICPCGYSVLDDSIQLGVKYTIDLDRRHNSVYRCGKCGLRQIVKVVFASQVLHPDRPMAPLPYGLFERLPKSR